MTNPTYKNSMGVHYLKALFFETAAVTEGEFAIYTLKNYDHTVGDKTYLSLHQLYIKTNDPTEYEFATKYFDSWQHWKKLKECNWFKPYYEDMKEELDIKIRSDALAHLRRQRSDPKNAVQVDKYLLERGWADKDDKRGRPNKEAIKKEADKIFKDAEFISDDYGRIVNG